MEIIDLSGWDLVLATLLIVSVACLSLKLKLNLEKQILISATRLIVQLLMIGWVLKVVFEFVDLRWVLLLTLVMLLAAGREVVARQKQRLTGVWSYAIGLSTLFLSTYFILLLALTVMLEVEPWYHPQYMIPMLGMLLGNTMTAISIGVDQVTQQAIQQKALIEQRLLLGETRMEATHDMAKEATRSALIPIINAMAAAGIVILPGMMTGQILAGSPPIVAVKYQILIMLLIATSTGFGSVVAIRLTLRRLFDERHRLRLDRLAS